MCERVNEWVGEWTSVSCPLANPVVWAPPSPAQVHLSQLFYGKPALLSIAIAASLHPHPLRDRTQMPLWAAGTKQGVLWGHQLVLPHGATRAMNRKTPKPSTHIISAFALEVTLSQSLCQKNAMELTVCSPRKAHKDGFWEVKGGLREGEFFPSITKWHKQQYQLGIHYQNKQRHSRRVCNRNPTRLDKLCKLKWWLSRSRVSLWMNTVIAGEP